MKIGGQEVTRCSEVCVLPRPSGDIIIKAEAVAISDDFNKLVPSPTAPGVRTKEGFKPDYENDDYLASVERRDTMKWNYIIIRSLAPSEIEWDTVDLNKPNTWGNWSDDLLKAGLSEVELQRIQGCVIDANSLNEKKLEKARESFLLGQVQ